MTSTPTHFPMMQQPSTTSHPITTTTTTTTSTITTATTGVSIVDSNIDSSGRTPSYLSSLNYMLHSPRSRTSAQTTPRTVRLINYENYTPTNFSVFPVFEVDTLEISNTHNLMNIQKTLSPSNLNQQAINQSSSASKVKPPTSLSIGVNSYSKTSEYHSSSKSFFPNKKDQSSLRTQPSPSAETQCSKIKNQHSYPSYENLISTTVEQKLKKQLLYQIPNIPTSDPIAEYPSLYENNSGSYIHVKSSPTLNAKSIVRNSSLRTPNGSKFFELEDFSDFSDNDDAEELEELEDLEQIDELELYKTTTNNNNRFENNVAEGLVSGKPAETQNEDYLLEDTNVHSFNIENIQLPITTYEVLGDSKKEFQELVDQSIKVLENKKLVGLETLTSSIERSQCTTIKKSRKLKLSTSNIHNLKDSNGNIVNEADVCPNNLKTRKRKRPTDYSKVGIKKARGSELHEDVDIVECFSNRRRKEFKISEDGTDAQSPLQKSIVSVTLAPFSAARHKKTADMANSKQLSETEVEKVLRLFSLRNFDIKLRILSKLLGNADISQTSFPPSNFDRGLVLTESPDGNLNVTAKTYAGLEGNKSIFDNSIMSFFKDVEEFAIYFRQPNGSDDTTGNLKPAKKLKITKVQKRKDLLAGSGKSTYIKRPLNSFMLYRTAMVKAVIFLSLIDTISHHIFKKLNMNYSNYNPGKELNYLTEFESTITPKLIHELKPTLHIHKFNHHLLIQIVSILWSNESQRVKKTFVSLAEVEKEIHAKCNPNYKYHPKRKV